MEFTPEQLGAIERRRGELLLDAGAGSGKTSVIVERFARAVLQDGIAIGQILTITFTEKAAAELRERIRARLVAAGEVEGAHATEGAWISTIHAFCARLLRSHALEAGIDPDFVVLDEREASVLRAGAFEEALAACARDRVGAELIAAHGIAALRGAIPDLHAELRAQGMLEPALPAVTEVPSPAALDDAAAVVLDRARAVARELGRERDPGRRVLDALAAVEQAPAVLADDLPWPGEVHSLRLAGGANALRTELCSDYNDSVDSFAEMVATVIAAEHRDALDHMLRAFDRGYSARKRERSALDFADLELLARELLRRHDVVKRYQERFLRVMVDEMQDTNHVQLELIDMVAGLDLFVVGDAQQSIYGFRHADVELFQQRGARLARIGARASLTTNFRSRPEILSVLNAAFEGALGESFMALRSGRDEPAAAEPLVELLVVDRDAVSTGERLLDEELEGAPWRVAEARALAARVAELIAAGGASAGEVVVLTRATTGIQIFERALEQAGVPTYVVGGRGYWSHPQVLQLIAYLRALANPYDTEARYTVFLSRLCGLSLDGLVLGAAGAVDDLSPPDRERLRRFEEWFERERRASAWIGPEQLLDRVISHSGYELALAAMPDGRRRLANVRKLMRLAREWQQAHGSDLRGFVDSLITRAGEADGARESEAPVESEALDAVRLMTVHRSKGLEFPVVCVADLGRLNVGHGGPLVRVGRDGESLGLRLKRPGVGERVSALDYDALAREQQLFELAEERRLFYVAMTRARERLIVSGAAHLHDWDATNRSSPIGWVGAALVPDISARASAGGSSVTPLRVRVSFLDGTAPPVRARLGVAAAQAGDHHTRPVPPVPPLSYVPPLQPAPLVQPVPFLQRVPPPPPPPSPAPSRPLITTLSYTSLASYERCPYRFYAERILGLPEAPPILPEPGPDAPVLTRRTVSGAARGRLIHELLAGLDFQRPSLRESMPADIRALLAGLIGSSTFIRLATLRDIRREQRFAFPVGQTLITGVFDLIGREFEDDQLLVVDYKSDSLDGTDPRTIVAERYLAQRSTYALAALKLGAAAVEVAHLFLEAPDEPVAAVFTAAQVEALERELAARIAGPLAGNFPVTSAPSRRVCQGCPAQDGLCSHPLELTNRP